MSDFQEISHGEVASRALIVSKALLGKDTDAISIKIQEDNITSIQEAIKNGKHDTMFYPACGKDLLRTMVAYDVTELMAVDEIAGTFIKSIQDEFAAAEIDLKVNDSKNGVYEMEFEFGNKQRHIILKEGDAKPAINNLQNESVDIFNVYASVGTADEFLTSRQLGYVKPGGFLVLGEKKFLSNNFLPEKLYEIAGIKQVKIKIRSPKTISGLSSSVNPIDTNGYIYQKTIDVDAAIIEDAANGIKLYHDLINKMSMLSSGEIISSNAQQNVSDIRSEFGQRLDEISKSMREHGVSEEVEALYRAEFIRNLTSGFKDVQKGYRDFLQVYDEVSSNLLSGKINSDEAMLCLGIVQGAYSKRNSMWPIATSFISRPKVEAGIRDFVRQFSEINFE